MENKEINLNIITQQYRKKGAALRGFKTIDKLIKTDDVVSLSILLRDHKEKPIYFFIEVQERDNIDFLIDYYSILEIGLIAGYMPNPLPRKTENEVEYVLRNKFINKYFTKYYPLYLPQILLKQVYKSKGEKYFNIKSSDESALLFDRFLLLNQIVKQDSDIDQFLWFLDDGWTDGYSISDFWNVLTNKNLIQYKLGGNNRHPLNRSLWGFVKYIQFLSDFADLLKDCENHSILQSAFWHYQSYWFEHMKENLGDIIKIGLKNIRQSMKGLNSDELISNKKSFLDSQEDFLKWQNNALELDGIENEINYLLNDKLGEPLIQLFNNQ